MDVAAWLQSLGLERYVPAFRDNDDSIGSSLQRRQTPSPRGRGSWPGSAKGAKRSAPSTIGWTLGMSVSTSPPPPRARPR